MDESVLRSQLVELLREGQAHIKAESALANVGTEFRNVRPAANVHSVWEELEHLRIAQEDILRYTIDPSWESPKWPDGYWPGATEKVSDEMWQASVAGFFADLEEVITLTKDANLDLTAKIPHGEGQTYLREILLVADHNAYHLGQIVQARKLLGDWRG
ncbi:MAG TPA: DinB family protein [Blastocatellia bacterium]|nr:DinB family protein [Blastocatellia bacterium]